MSATIHKEWYNANEQRDYPLDAQATQVGDDGTRIPEDILADLNLCIPSTLASRIFVSGLTVTSYLVTVTISAKTESGSVAVAAVTVEKPVLVYRNYTVTPLFPGVMGWAVFGYGVAQQTNLAVRCSSESQGLIAPRAGRSYSTLPVSSIGIENTAEVSSLTGMVALDSSGDLIIEEAQRLIDEECKTVILLRINSEGNPTLLSDYAGPCGKRPGTGTCSDVPIRGINNVEPDCDGNIDINFSYPVLPSGIQYNSNEDLDGTFILDMPFGLADVCPQPREIEGSQKCDEETPGMLGDIGVLSEFDTTILSNGITLLETENGSSEGSSDGSSDGSDAPVLTYPFCEDFSDSATEVYWENFGGSWEIIPYLPTSSDMSSSSGGSLWGI